MKQTIRVWITELKSACSELLFLFSLLLGIILLMTGSIYTDENGKSYHAISLLYYCVKERKLNYDEFFVNELVKTGTTFSHFWMYAPLVVLIPLAVILIVEKKDKFQIFKISRVNYGAYAVGRFLATFTVGGMTLFGSVFFYGIYIMLFFLQGEQFFGIKELFVLCMKYFLYGGISTIPGYLISIYSKNIYLFLCIPFIFNYLWNLGFAYKVIFWKAGILKDIAVAIENISALNVDGMSKNRLIYFLVIHIGISLVAILLQIRRWKSGKE